jgi:GTP-binding protein EngB required for normal cell division
MMLEFAAKLGKPLILVLTKADKLNQSERHTRKKAIYEQLGEASPEKVLCYSAPKNIGHRELSLALQEILLTKE